MAYSHISLLPAKEGLPVHVTKYECGIPNAAIPNAVIPNAIILNTAFQKILHTLLQHFTCSQLAGSVARDRFKLLEVITNDFVRGSEYSDNKAITLISS